eukprot:scaffold180_cov311-Pinguiococcus_pyrenoidosus.AAC.6
MFYLRKNAKHELLVPPSAFGRDLKSRIKEFVTDEVGGTYLSGFGFVINVVDVYAVGIPEPVDSDDPAAKAGSRPVAKYANLSAHQEPSQVAHQYLSQGSDR